jgi:hypothetical protein
MVATVLDEKQVLMYIGCSTTVQTMQTLSTGSLSSIDPSGEVMPNAMVGSPRITKFRIAMLNLNENLDDWF